jgi:hypothetical protein
MPVPIPERIDWMGLTTKLGEDIQYAVDTRKRERAALDEQAKTVEKEINTYEGGQDQKFSELVFNGVDKGRDLVYEWTNAAKRGEMTRAELKLRMNNLSEGLSGFAKSAKDFDARMVEILNRQNSGEAGKLEAYKNNVSETVWPYYKEIVNEYNFGIIDRYSFFCEDLQKNISRRLSFQLLDFLPDIEQDYSKRYTVSFD